MVEVHGRRLTGWSTLSILLAQLLAMDAFPAACISQKICREGYNAARQALSIFLLSVLLVLSNPGDIMTIRALAE